MASVFTALVESTRWPTQVCHRMLKATLFWIIVTQIDLLL